MSEEQVPQGSIPPKVSPFSKPEGASPITPASPGTPRPITVRLKPAAPASATPTASTQKPPSDAIAATPLAASPRLTARVPIPELPPPGQASVPIPRPPTAQVPEVPGVASPVASPAPTVRLRPVSQAPAVGTAPTPPPAPVMTPITSMQPTPPPTPGSHPLPDGPKPPSGAQVQAAKSKTSRISLDSAIGVAPMTPMSGEKSEPKTIRLKRPADLSAPAPKVSTAPIRQTSRIPDSVLPAAETAAAEGASVTQKKTLKIKRPGAQPEAGAALAAEGAAGADGVPMTPISALDLQPIQEESKVFTGVAVVVAAAAAVVMVLLTICLGAHAVGTVANKNTTASISGFELPWPGRIAN